MAQLLQERKTDPSSHPRVRAQPLWTAMLPGISRGGGCRVAGESEVLGREGRGRGLRGARARTRHRVILPLVRGDCCVPQGTSSRGLISDNPALEGSLLQAGSCSEKVPGP